MARLDAWELAKRLARAGYVTRVHGGREIVVLGRGFTGVVIVSETVEVHGLGDAGSVVEAMGVEAEVHNHSRCLSVTDCAKHYGNIPANNPSRYKSA